MFKKKIGDVVLIEEDQKSDNEKEDIGNTSLLNFSNSSFSSFGSIQSANNLFSRPHTPARLRSSNPLSKSESFNTEKLTIHKTSNTDIEEIRRMRSHDLVKIAFLENEKEKLEEQKEELIKNNLAFSLKVGLLKKQLEKNNSENLELINLNNDINLENLGLKDELSEEKTQKNQLFRENKLNREEISKKNEEISFLREEVEKITVYLVDIYKIISGKHYYYNSNNSFDYLYKIIENIINQLKETVENITLVAPYNESLWISRRESIVDNIKKIIEENKQINSEQTLTKVSDDNYDAPYENYTVPSVRRITSTHRKYSSEQENSHLLEKILDTLKSLVEDNKKNNSIEINYLNNKLLLTSKEQHLEEIISVFEDTFGNLIEKMNYFFFEEKNDIPEELKNEIELAFTFICNKEREHNKDINSYNREELICIFSDAFKDLFLSLWNTVFIFLCDLIKQKDRKIRLVKEELNFLKGKKVEIKKSKINDLEEEIEKQKNKEIENFKIQEKKAKLELEQKNIGLILENDKLKSEIIKIKKAFFFAFAIVFATFFWFFYLKNTIKEKKKRKKYNV